MICNLKVPQECVCPTEQHCELDAPKQGRDVLILIASYSLPLKMVTKYVEGEYTRKKQKQNGVGVENIYF